MSVLKKTSADHFETVISDEDRTVPFGLQGLASDRRAPGSERYRWWR